MIVCKARRFTISNAINRLKDAENSVNLIQYLLISKKCVDM